MRAVIITGPLRRFFFKRKIKGKGFYYIKDKNGKYFRRHIDDDKTELIKEIKHFCRRRLLRLYLQDDSMDRRSAYRNTFFKNNKGFLGLYFCAYCGRPMRKRKVKVDHIVPVYLAGNSLFYRGLLERRGIKTVNDARNLAASCFECNARKGSRGGIWVLRGILGKSTARTLFRELFLLLAGGIVLYYLTDFLYVNIYQTVAPSIYNFLVGFYK